VFVVDLPEGHLHPRPQAALADFFCALALSGRRCLVETHSEMFFHRLRLRAAMSAELAQRTAIYFIEPPDEQGLCCDPRLISLEEGKNYTWPADFLLEGWELETQIEAAWEARRSHGDR
jgi:predicted ATPase